MPVMFGMADTDTTPVTRAFTLNPAAIILTDCAPRIVTP